MPKNKSPVAKLAFKFVLIIGIVDLFADIAAGFVDFSLISFHFKKIGIISIVLLK